MKLNCAAIPTGLLESELFGHEKVAFTGAISQKIGRMELADKGTLFLDEVGKFRLKSSRSYCVLCRSGSSSVWQHTYAKSKRSPDRRNQRDLEKMVANREFRSDLYYRLNVFPCAARAE